MPITTIASFQILIISVSNCASLLNVQYLPVALYHPPFDKPHFFTRFQDIKITISLTIAMKINLSISRLMFLSRQRPRLLPAQEYHRALEPRDF